MQNLFFLCSPRRFSVTRINEIVSSTLEIEDCWSSFGNFGVCIMARFEFHSSTAKKREREREREREKNRERVREREGEREEEGRKGKREEERRERERRKGGSCARIEPTYYFQCDKGDDMREDASTVRTTDRRQMNRRSRWTIASPSKINKKTHWLTC